MSNIIKKENLIALYKKGLKNKEIAKIFNISPSYVARLLKKCEKLVEGFSYGKGEWGARKKTNFTKEGLLSIFKSFNYDRTKICNHFNITHSTLYYWVKKYDLISLDKNITYRRRNIVLI